MKADLHMHTTRSFDVESTQGGKSAKQLLDLIKHEGKVQVVSFTDHDKLSKKSDFDYASNNDLIFVGGGEVSTSSLGFKQIHVLVYFNPQKIDIGEIQKELNNLMKGRRVMCASYVKRLIELGVFKPPRFQRRQLIQENMIVSRAELAQMLTSRRYTYTSHRFNDIHKAWEFLGGQDFRNIQRQSTNTKKLCDIVRKSEGLTILAHPWQIKYRDGTRINLDGIERLVNLTGIDGIEGYYPYHWWKDEISPDQSKKMNFEIREWASGDPDFLITGGSDFHRNTNPRKTCLPGRTYLPHEHTIKLLERLGYDI